MVLCDVLINNLKPKSAYWHFNTALLCDANFKDFLKVFWGSFLKLYAVHEDQTYCVPGRSILDNVSLIRDIFEISSSLGIKTGLISLDQEKAFDRVEHLYLWKILESFGLSPGLIAMIKVLYQDVESELKINRGLSAPFKVCRGVRQGCSLPGMLYSMSIEPLRRKLRAKIEGLI